MASLAAAVSIRGRCLDPAGGAVSKALSMAILNFGTSYAHILWSYLNHLDQPASIETERLDLACPSSKSSSIQWHIPQR